MPKRFINFKRPYSRPREVTGIRPILLIVFVVLLVMPFVLFGFLSVRILEPKLLSEFETQTITAAKGVQRRVDHAVSAFGGMHTLRDVTPVLEHARLSAPGMSFLALTDSDKTILHLSADDPTSARRKLALATVSNAPDPIGRFEGLFLSVTETSLSDPVITTSQRYNDLFVTKLPLGGNDQYIGILYAGVDIGTLNSLKRDIWIDTGVAVFAVVLLAVELLLLVFAIYFSRPAWAIDFLTARLRDNDVRFRLRDFRGGAAQRLIRYIDDNIVHAAAYSRSAVGLRLPTSGDPRPLRIPAVSYVRMPLFFFFLSEALLRPILPQFLGTFAPPGSDPNFRIGILMASFMAASLFSVMIGSVLSDRSGGPRQVFVWGTICSGCGMYGHLVAGDFTSVLLLRMLTGFGYGLVYAAAQVHIAQHADPNRRSAGFSLFLSAVVAAEICGPAVGGILADRFGDALVILTATLVIFFAAILCVFLLSKFPPDITDPATVPEENEPAVKNAHRSLMNWVSEQRNMVLGVLANKRFFVTVLCFAIPAKIMLTGGLFFLVPLTVYSSGGDAVESARVLMGYGIAILLLVPALAPLADRFRGFGTWIAVGGMTAGVGFILPHASNVFEVGGLKFVFIATLLFGFGQTLSIPTQISFLLAASDRQTRLFGTGSVLGLFRFLERLGSLAGPLIAGMLLLVYPPDVALMWMGLGFILLAAVGLSWFLAFGQQDEEEAINALLVET